MNRAFILSTRGSPTMITALPVDILELIVEYLAEEEPFGPPRGLLRLSSTCRALYRALGFKCNSTPYAETFRREFDILAPLRRFENEVFPNGSRRVGSAGLASELKARFKALHYMRSVITSSNLFCFSSEETLTSLWTIYFMCIESDEKNSKYLFKYADLKAYASICMDQYLFQSLDDVELLEDTVDRSLMMWIAWFATSTSNSSTHNLVQGDSTPR